MIRKWFVRPVLKELEKIIDEEIIEAREALKSPLTISTYNRMKGIISMGEYIKERIREFD